MPRGLEPRAAKGLFETLPRREWVCGSVKRRLRNDPGYSPLAAGPWGSECLPKPTPCEAGSIHRSAVGTSRTPTLARTVCNPLAAAQAARGCSPCSPWLALPRQCFPVTAQCGRGRRSPRPARVPARPGVPRRRCAVDMLLSPGATQRSCSAQRRRSRARRCEGCELTRRTRCTHRCCRPTTL